uniref:Lipocalin n=1 Tax=Rhipicephalus zambeziensis TaxID=60191 RepID=A0A224YMW6_9ACAR
MLTHTVTFFILGTNAVSAMFKGGSAHCRENNNGWPFMSGSAPMRLTERNFNTDSQNRNLTKCVSAVRVSADERSHILEQNITYFNESSKTWISFQKNFSAAAWGTYNLDINFFWASGPGGINLTYYVLHAERDCLVTKLLYRRSGKGSACEIWVTDDYFERRSVCCDYFYHISCEKTQQILYEREECSEMEKYQKGNR